MNYIEAKKMLDDNEHLVDSATYKGKLIDGIAIVPANGDRIAEIAHNLISGKPFGYILHSYKDFEVFVFFGLDNWTSGYPPECLPLSVYLNHLKA